MRRLSALSSTRESFGIPSNASGIILSCLSLRFFSYHNDYFSLLSVNRNVKVDLDVLRKNYHAFQSEHHPDLHPSSGAASPSSSPTPNLKDATAYASNAYSVLKDPFLRCRYLRLLLEADSKAILSQDKALLPSGEDYYNLAVSHDATEGKEAASAAAKHGGEGGDIASSICEAVRSDDKKANPVNHDQAFLMEMMELNMRLAEALELDSEDPARKKELDALKAEVTQLEEHYFDACKSLYSRVLALRGELLGENAAAASAGSSAKDVFAMAKNQFRDTVLKWTFASNLRRQINEAY